MKAFNPEKELRKIQHGRKNKIICTMLFGIILLTIGYSFALYQVRYSKRIIYTKVAPFSNKDLELAIYLDGDKLDKLPEKDEEYYYESIVCDNDPSATAEWDYANQKLEKLSAITLPNKCKVNFTTHPTTLTLIERIKYLNGAIPEVVIDDETKDHNLRYIGAGPDNYIWFNCNDYDAEMDEENCEKWRIIGLFKDIDVVDGENTIRQDLVKIIRSDSIGNIAYGTSNNWTNSTLQKSLNGTYYNGTGLSNGKGITDDTRGMIEQVKWNLGGHDSSSTTAVQYYIDERESVTYGGQPSIWNGYVGLMYSSDYGYATSGSGLPDDSEANREGCLNSLMRFWTSGNLNTYCAGNDWLFEDGVYQWTLTHRYNYADRQDRIEKTGYIDCNGNYVVGGANAVRPALYLNSSIKIKHGAGNGSSETPYTLIP